MQHSSHHVPDSKMVNNDNKLIAQEYHQQKPDFEKGEHQTSAFSAAVSGARSPRPACFLTGAQESSTGQAQRQQ